MDLAFIYTDYQYKVLMASRKIEGKEHDCFYIVLPSTLDLTSAGLNDIFLKVTQKDRSINFFNARRLVKEVKILLSRVSPIETIWMASDDHPIGQLILRILNYNNVYLIEDGIGSYIPHSFLSVDRGYRSVLGKLKNIFYYFPYYGSLRGCGAVASARNYAYSSTAFPLQKSKTVVVSYPGPMSSVRFSFPCDSILVLGQPLALDLGLDEDYCFGLVKEALRKINASKVYFKPHPRQSEEDVKRFIKYFSEVNAQALWSSFNAEDLIAISDCPDLRVLSFISTALVNIKNQNPSMDVYYIRIEGVSISEAYYNVLQASGVVQVEVV